MGEGLKEFFDKILVLVLKREEAIKIYRLLCLYTQVEGGIKPDDYHNIRKEIVESYGFAHMQVFNQLSQAGLLYSKADAKKWKAGYPTSKKEHKLLNMDLRKENPARKSYPYAEYTPVSVKVVEHAFRQSWVGGWVSEKLHGHTSVVGDIRNVSASREQRKVVVLYVVGGVTYAEVGCLRQLAKQMNVELLIATTNIINSKRLLEPFMPN